MSDPKPTPLELLEKRPSPITDVVYGSDHPLKQPKRPPKQRTSAARTGLSQVGDLLSPSTRNALEVMKWKAERAQSRMNKRKERKAS